MKTPPIQKPASHEAAWLDKKLKERKMSGYEVRTKAKFKLYSKQGRIK